MQLNITCHLSVNKHCQHPHEMNLSEEKDKELLEVMLTLHVASVEVIKENSTKKLFD